MKLVYGHHGRPAHPDVRVQEHVRKVSALPATPLWWICPLKGKLDDRTRTRFLCNILSARNYVYSKLEFGNINAH